MSEITNKQNYELAFHIIPSLEEADVQRTRQELEKSVIDHGGVISFSKDPERVRLAYPIKHQTSAYFGFFNFNLESPESLNQIRDELRLKGNVLRSLLLKHEEESQTKKEDVIRRLAMAEKRKARAKQAEKQASQKDAPKMDEKVLDEKLEEIIEKL